VVNIETAVVFSVTPCSLLDTYRHSGVTGTLSLQAFRP